MILLAEPLSESILKLLLIKNILSFKGFGLFTKKHTLKLIQKNTILS